MISAAWLDNLVCVALRQQFPDFEVTPGNVRGAPTNLVGIVGFRCASGMGSVGIAASESTLQTLSPDIGSSRLDHSDWIGELANQSLGRLKLSLSLHGVDLVSSTPVVLCGMSLQVSRSQCLRTFIVRTGEHLLSLWLDVGTIEFPETAPVRIGAGDPSVQPGESLFFD